MPDYAQNAYYYGASEQVVPQLYYGGAHGVPELGQPEPPSERDRLKSFVAFQISEFSLEESKHLSKLAALTQHYPGLLDELLMEETTALQHIRETEEDVGRQTGRSEHAIRTMITTFVDNRKTKLLDNAYNIVFPERDDAHDWSYDYKKGKINEAYGFRPTLASIFESDSDSD